jgi:hypothetical protein
MVSLAALAPSHQQIASISPRCTPTASTLHLHCIYPANILQISCICTATSFIEEDRTNKANWTGGNPITRLEQVVERRKCRECGFLAVSDSLAQPSLGDNIDLPILLNHTAQGHKTVNYSYVIIAVLAIVALVGWIASADDEFISDEEAWEHSSQNPMSSNYEE